MKLEPDDVFLAQGTLRPDLIESASLLASTNAHIIKTHHNDTQLVRQLREQVCKISPQLEPTICKKPLEIIYICITLFMPHVL